MAVITRGPKRYEVVVYVGIHPGTGKPKHISRTVRGTKAEAKRKETALKADVQAGRLTADTGRTVGQLLDKWLEVTAPDLSPTTVEGYRSKIKHHLRPTIGAKRLAKLKTEDVDRLYAGLRAKGLSAASVRQCHAILRRALRQAEVWRWIPPHSNPADQAQKPKVRPDEYRLPEAVQIVQLLNELERKNPEVATFVLVAAGTGARRGEVCGLRWSDIDWEDHSLLIARAVIDADNKVMVKDTKTHAYRRISLDPATLEALRRHRDYMANRARIAQMDLEPHAYVFSSEADSSAPWHPDWPSGCFQKTRNRMGFRFKLHDLRHFSVSRQLAAGVPVRTVAGRHGHASADMTLKTYGHFIPASDRQAAVVMGDLLADAEKPPSLPAAETGSDGG